ncbi:hypothetical protein [Deinococcus maricopensis]|uniref:Uncharacterized protein n=1 Tax=Deinococcus maricopensis (strain DSM 21211 / LMG 22137 / NRRL B-23946 / LB-34) TaxID=709986 RepID=E8UA25_DEIML|nr:hypothetical protein [Deinococcus maricopensis]ADV67914.1 hypothetical protein Deima_2276 [Deinococcus maricopensis DSM 21211]
MTESPLPVLTHWRVVLHGGPITVVGLVYGHPEFRNGAAIETSELSSCCAATGVIATLSGSRYRLATHALITERDRDQALTALEDVLNVNEFGAPARTSTALH